MLFIWNSNLEVNEWIMPKKWRNSIKIELKTLPIGQILDFMSEMHITLHDLVWH